MNADNLFLDFETTGLSPYHGDRIVGWAMTADDLPDIWYVPIRHSDKSWNLPLDGTLAYLRDLLRTAKRWINHRVKFDAHFAHVDGCEFGGMLCDTLTYCKMLIEEELWSYDLDIVVRECLGIDMLDSYRKIKAFLEGIKSKCYADIPADMLGDYACEDVNYNRQIARWIGENTPEDMGDIMKIETLLTPVLYDIEQVGMPVNPTELKVEKVKVLRKITSMADELAQLMGREVNPKSPKDMYDVMINEFGLPVLQWNKNKQGERSGPCFEAEVLEKYMVHPIVMADKRMSRVVTLMSEYREEANYLSLFVEKYLDHHVNGILHPDYNQLVSTGRMSCSSPNAQQLSKRAKRLIHPLQGQALLSCDYSQVEFRLIVHYIQDQEAIQAYNTDPSTDFHQWVADQCGIKRKQAKNINFAIGYGAGKGKVTRMLAADPIVIERVSEQMVKDNEGGRLVKALYEELNSVPPEELSDEARAALLGGDNGVLQFEFNRRTYELASRMYTTYHERLPSLKRTSYRACDICETRGFVKTAYGRRRFLSKDDSYRAFNSVIQGTAADIMKERTIAVAPRYNSEFRNLGINIIWSVHDDTGFMGPAEVMLDPKVQKMIYETLEDTRIKFRIPIRTDMGYSTKSWYEAGQDDPVVVDGKFVGGAVERN